MLFKKTILELRSATCCMGSHSVVCNPTLNAPRLNPRQISRYSLYLLRGMKGWVDQSGWLHTKIVYLPKVTHPSKVFNRPEFSGRYDFQAKKFGRQCAKPGSHAVYRSTRKLKQKLNAKQYLGPTTYVSLTHQQCRSWFLRAITQLCCMARL